LSLVIGVMVLELSFYLRQCYMLDPALFHYW